MHGKSKLREHSAICYADSLGTSIGYDEILARASEGDGYMTFGDDISGTIPDEFWDHVEAVTGNKINNRAGWFSCAC